MTKLPEKYGAAEKARALRMYDLCTKGVCKPTAVIQNGTLYVKKDDGQDWPGTVLAYPIRLRAPRKKKAVR